MKVLIVDDGDEKVGPILSLLEAEGIASESIDVVNCVNDAKNKLRASQYALALLDLSLGLRPGLPKSHQNGADLVKWISEPRTRCLRPWRSLVVTCQGDAYVSQKAVLEQLGIPVVKWDSVGGDARKQILQEVKLMMELEKAGALTATSNRVDVCILTALVDPEYTTVLAIFESAGVQWSEGKDQMANSKFGRLARADGVEVSILVVATGEMGGVAAASACVEVLGLFKPKLVIMAGICGGFEGKVELGDVICATEMINFGAGKMFDGVFVPDSKSVPTDVARWPVLNDRARMDALLEEANTSWRGVRPARTDGGVPRYRRGQTGCSDMVIADQNFVSNLLTKYRDMKGVEMEGFGAGHAVRWKGNGTAFLMFKGVCDMADPEKRNEYQGFAAHLSAKLVALLLTSGLVSP